MVSQGDIETVEINGEVCRVEVLSRELEEQYLDDIWIAERGATSFEVVDSHRLRVEPAYDRAVFSERELSAIDDHEDWTIVDVGEGAHGKMVVVEYTG